VFLGSTLVEPGDTTEPFVCGGDASFYQITVTICYYCQHSKYSDTAKKMVYYGPVLRY